MSRRSARQLLRIPVCFACGVVLAAASIVAYADEPKSAPQSPQGPAGVASGEAASDVAVGDGELGAGEALLRPGDTLALVGGTLIERMQAYPWLEAKLQTRRPDWKLRLRNLGWSGDDAHGFARKVFDPNPEKGYQRLLHDLDLAKPSVVLIAYGFAEASNGAEAVERFEPALTRLVEAMIERQRRVILLRPFAMPGVRTPDYARHVQNAGEVVDRVAAQFGIPALGVTCDQFQADGLLPDEAGYRMVADGLAGLLLGDEDSPKIANAEAYSRLTESILRKDEWFFHRHRPQNETYLMLFRKHEQGNNMVDLPQFDALIDELEPQLWELGAEASQAEAGK